MKIKDTTPTTTRIDALNDILAHSKHYKLFVAAADCMGLTWATDADLEAFEAKVAATLNWAVALPDWGHLWMIAAQQILDGRLTWAKHQSNELALVVPEPVVDIPTEQGGYFPDDPFAEGGEA